MLRINQKKFINQLTNWNISIPEYRHALMDIAQVICNCNDYVAKNAMIRLFSSISIDPNNIENHIFQFIAEVQECEHYITYSTPLLSIVNDGYYPIQPVG